MSCDGVLTTLDILVQNFLNKFNYQYFVIYPARFSERYSEYWTDRLAGRQPSAGLTCLLLRVCSWSVQFIDPKSRHTLEHELGAPAQALTERFHRFASTLSARLKPGESGVEQVQQLFLTSSWQKYEGDCQRSWHDLSAAIREAQELGMSYTCFLAPARLTSVVLGMHRAEPPEPLTEFELEIRRRVWCVLYIWDW